MVTEVLINGDHIFANVIADDPRTEGFLVKVKKDDVTKEVARYKFPENGKYQKKYHRKFVVIGEGDEQKVVTAGEYGVMVFKSQGEKEPKAIQKTIKEFPCSGMNVVEQI